METEQDIYLLKYSPADKLESTKIRQQSVTDKEIVIHGGHFAILSDTEHKQLTILNLLTNTRLDQEISIEGKRLNYGIAQMMAEEYLVDPRNIGLQEYKLLVCTLDALNDNKCTIVTINVRQSRK